ncbi:MAG: major capsid protein [Oscillospiraceae bacterium]|jgi:hypothetical protein|nr:major capsid protein [Oscillospiraceae bacterium]
MIDISSAAVLIQAIQNIKPFASFLKDRYFPSSPSDFFETEYVLFEQAAVDSRKLALVVSKHKKGIKIESAGYKIDSFKPPLLAPEHTISSEELNKRGFGEVLLGSKSQTERE